MDNRLQVGIDFSHRRADLALLSPEGEPIVMHRGFANSSSGYLAAKKLLIETLQANEFDGLNVSGEATSYYWLPFFLQLATDPDWKHYKLEQFVLNPRWVHWFKKCSSPNHKTDETDPFYIADRTRTLRRPVPWSPQLDTLPLRFYTRLRFHLVQDLTREKCYCSAHLFLKASGYRQIRPFEDTFGPTSRQLLSQEFTPDELAAMSPEDLAALLYDLGGHHLRDRAQTADKVKLMAKESFPIPDCLELPLQRLVAQEIQHIQYLDGLIAQVERWIADEATSHPAVANLATIPGIGPVFSAGIFAEVGSIQRFLDPPKWDKRRRRYRPRNLRDAEDAVAKIAGLWWPRADSGDFEAEDRRMAKSGNRYLRYYQIQAADHMRKHIPEYARFYDQKYQEATKHKHKRALVLTARKSVGLVVGLLHRNEPYRSKED